MTPFRATPIGREVADNYVPQSNQDFSAIPNSSDYPASFSGPLNNTAIGHGDYHSSIPSTSGMSSQESRASLAFGLPAPTGNAYTYNSTTSGYPFTHSTPQRHPYLPQNPNPLSQHQAYTPAITQPSQPISGPTDTSARPLTSTSAPVHASNDAAGAASSAASHHESSTSEADSLNSHGLHFASFDAASLVCEPIFRQLLEIPNDDIDEVELNKSSHVKSLVDALKTRGFKDPPTMEKGTGGQMNQIPEEIRKKVIKSFERADKACGIILKQGAAAMEVEYHAWNIFKQITMVHRIGRRNHGRIQDLHVKCSERIEMAIEVITNNSMVRRKLLDADDVPGFSANPHSYAYVVRRNLKNNNNRKTNDDPGKVVGSEPAQETAKEKPAGRGAAVDHGSVSRRHTAATDTAKPIRGRKARKTKASQDVTSAGEQVPVASTQDDSKGEQSSTGHSAQRQSISRGYSTESEQRSPNPFAGEAQAGGVLGTASSNEYEQWQDPYLFGTFGTNDNSSAAATNNDSSTYGGAFHSDSEIHNMFDEMGNWKPEYFHMFGMQVAGSSSDTNEYSFNGYAYGDTPNTNDDLAGYHERPSAVDFSHQYNNGPTNSLAQAAGNHYGVTSTQPSMRPYDLCSQQAAPYGNPMTMPESMQSVTSSAADGLGSKAPTNKKRKR
ncbi:hypothetical protein Q7P37_007111 [Cladosporium fusiforme]